MKNKYIIILMIGALFLSSTSCAQKNNSASQTNKLNLSSELLKERESLKKNYETIRILL